MFAYLMRWFRDSGIAYPYRARHVIRETQIIDLLPLEDIIEDRDHPFARIYRTTFWQGIKDTFHVLIGDHFDENLKGHGVKGVLDLLIFPVISRRLKYFISDFYGNIHPIAWLIAGPIILPLELARFALGAAITLALTPIIALVHAVAHFKTKPLMQATLKTKTVTLGRPQQIHNLTIEKFIQNPIENNYRNPNNDHDHRWSIVMPHEKIVTDENSKVTFTSVNVKHLWYKKTSCIEITPENEKGIQALLTLNSRNILTALKSQGLPTTTAGLMNMTSEEKEIRKILYLAEAPSAASIKDNKDDTCPMRENFFNSSLCDLNVLSIVNVFANIPNPNDIQTFNNHNNTSPQLTIKQVG